MGTALDIIFLIAALFGAWAVSRWRRRRKDAKAQPRKYLPTILMAATLLALLLASWVANGRGLSDLGLAVPDTRGLFGVGVALVVAGGMALVVLLSDPSKRPAGEDMGDKVRDMPEGAREWAAYLVFALAVGFGWEVIYRGALMFHAVPWIGVWPAVVVCALAYTLVHGAESRTAWAGTFVAAFAFLTLFVLSGSLWGPVLLHVLMPLVMGLAAMRMRRISPESRERAL